MRAPWVRSRLDLIVTLAGIAVLAVLTGVQLHLTRILAQEPSTLWQGLIFGAGSWITWAVASPAILALGRAFDFRPGHRVQSALVHVGAMAACHIPSSMLLTLTGTALFGQNETVTRKILVQSVLSTSRLQLSVVVYAAILGVGLLVALTDRLHHREVQAARLGSQAAQARLQALGMRLQPHFLFNALHTVGVLVEEDPRQARAMLVTLGDLLRDVLQEPDEIEIPLREELELLRRYLAIEQVRFADRLAVTIDADPDVLELLVPRLLLQPLVENAARHGIAPIAAGGRIAVTARRQDGRLALRVWNNGAPLRADHGERTGINTTRARLDTRHGDAASLVLQPSEGGVESLVVLPAVTRD